MSESEFSCGLCSQQYDTAERTPRLIPSCGHTYCTACLKQLQKMHPKQLIICPED